MVKEVDGIERSLIWDKLPRHVRGGTDKNLKKYIINHDSWSPDLVLRAGPLSKKQEWQYVFPTSGTRNMELRMWIMNWKG